MRPDFFQNILDGRCARRKAMNQVCVFADQSEQQVFGLDGHTPELTRLIAGEENDSARSFGVPFKHCPYCIAVKPQRGLEPALQLSEVDARVENETPHSAIAAGINAAGQTRDCAEIGGVNVCDRSCEVRMVQHIDDIDPELELLALMNSESFDHIHVQVERARTSERRISGRSNLSRLRIHQKHLCVRSGNCLIVEACLQSVQSGYLALIWIIDLRVSIEVRDTAGQLCDCADVARHGTDDVRFGRDVRDGLNT